MTAVRRLILPAYAGVALFYLLVPIAVVILLPDGLSVGARRLVHRVRARA